MVDPTTPNILLAVPTRGSDPGTWDIPVNGNSSGLDGYLGGVQTISVSNASFSLTAPSGTVTAGGGPTQAQNAVLVFTGTLTADVTVTLPLPGYYIINNQSNTTTNKLLFFRAVGSGNIIAPAFGETVHIFNDGTNVSFANLARVGAVEIWAGLSTMPRWVTACTVPPYLLNDGTIYNFSTYPALGAQLLGVFGGNGVTTFGVPDHRGRVPLVYDGTGTRITTAGCGINGQTLGAVNPGGGGQTNIILTANLPPYSPAGSIVSTIQQGGTYPLLSAILAGGNTTALGGAATGGTAVSLNGLLGVVSTFTGSPQGGTSSPFAVVQPSQVTGISVIRAA